VRFLTRTPSSRCSPFRLPRRAAGAPWRLLAGLVVALIAVLAADGSLAEEFELGQLTDNIDFTVGAGKEPTGALVAGFAVAGLDLGLRHTEFMAGMARPWLYGKPKNDRLLRSSLVDGGTRVDLGSGVALPLGISFGLDERQQGSRNLRTIARHGLHLDGVQLDHRLTVTTALAPDGTETRNSTGRLALRLDLFGGRQEGVAEYGAGPETRLTQLRMNSEWRLAEASTAVVGVTHRPLDGLSQARAGLRRSVGALKMTSDVVADSAGGYAVGLRFALPLNAAPKRESWSLAGLVANLRAERQPAVPVDSEATSAADAN